MNAHQHTRHHHHPHPVENLPWLDRLSMAIPGYIGYEVPERRRAAALALRDAVTYRLERLKGEIQQAIADCIRREARTEIHALERIDLHIDRILDRLKRVGTRALPFYESGGPLDPARLEPVYALDHAIMETADLLAHHFEKPDLSHDRLAEIEAELKALEHKMDERVILLEGLS